MKNLILYIGVLNILLVYDLNGQTTCQVLQPNILGKYIGDCKNGLADGKGESTGIDFYRGEFKKGFPDGIGTYIWYSGDTYIGEWKHGLRDGKGEFKYKYGGQDSLLVGIWKDDKFIGSPSTQPYSVDYKNTISRVTFIKVGNRPYVKYKFSRAGGEVFDITNIMLQGSSGSESNSSGFTGFEQISFPFKGKVSFTSPNAFMTSILTCELRFTINNPGSWIITMFY